MSLLEFGCQNTLYIKNKEQYLEKDYIIDKSNAKIYKAIIENNYFANSSFSSKASYKNFSLIYGSKSSGKTHLATIWARKNNAIEIIPNGKDLAEILNNYHEIKSNYFLIDNIELFDATELFHAFNLINESNKFCLITTSEYPFNSSLPDLNSRINAIKSFKLQNLNYESVYLFLKKQLLSKSINFTDNALRYLGYRIPSEINKIEKIIDFLDKKSLQEQSKITTFFIKSIFHEMQNMNDIIEK